MDNASQPILELQELRCYIGSVTNPTCGVRKLSDVELLLEVKRLAAREREATAQLIASIAELDARRLYLGEGYSSLFSSCTQCLCLSEHAAYGRIEAARAARRWPIILELLSDGTITLTTVCLLASYLSEENHQVALEAARGKSKREVEQQVAAMRPLTPVPSSVRKLPTRQPSGQSNDVQGNISSLPQPSAAGHARPRTEAPSRPAAVSGRPPVVAPLASDLYKVQFTVSRETHDKLRQAQDLLRHSVPDGNPAAIFDRALTLLLAEIRKRKCALTTHPRSARTQTASSRYIPASVKRIVWERDGGQCTFVGKTSRCGEKAFWNSTISSRLRLVGPRRPTISSFAVELTTRMRPASTLGSTRFLDANCRA